MCLCVRAPGMPLNLDAIPEDLDKRYPLGDRTRPRPFYLTDEEGRDLHPGHSASHTLSLSSSSSKDVASKGAGDAAGAGMVLYGSKGAVGCCAQCCGVCY